ncbi:hypothetical protein HAHE_35810 [Haloferula helveola]|uniref:Porin n=1 Tax=Haloferula helveola TaxID=490095 RepID=A0ABM7RH83_9BACT|nr:hypothetical protein HAHE_35810 [Haloferula helveola]
MRIPVRILGIGFTVMLAFHAAQAGELGAKTPVSQPPSPSGGDWCKSLVDFPKLYKNDENPYLQELNLYLVYHHQYTYIDGKDRNGRHFNDVYDENRRFWWGFNGRFLDYFKFKFASNASRDLGPAGGRWQLGHENFRSAYVSFDAGRAFGIEAVDSLEFGYGRRSIRMTDQWQRSATHINTIERADFSNKMWPNDEDGSNPLAAWLKFTKGLSTVDIAVVSTDESGYMPSWNAGTMLFVSWEGDFAGMTPFDMNDLWFSFFYQDADIPEDRLAGGIEWALAGVSRIGRGPWAVHTSLGIGDNGDQTNPRREGMFWGGYVMPMYWIVDGKLKLVLRYQYQGAEEPDGIRLNGRYARVAEQRLGLALNGGRGDEHHNLYAGLNWYLCGENVKLMTGVQYDRLESDGQRIYSGWTTSVAARFFF